MPESPDYLSLFRSFVPEETPEQKAARLLAEEKARQQANTPEITATRTADQGLEDFIQRTGSAKGYADAVISGQKQMDATRGQMMAEADKAQYDLPGLSSAYGNGLQDVAKLYNKPLESMLRATGTPQLGGMVGEQIGEDVGRLTGSKADLEGIGRGIGESVPRMIAGGAGLGVPGMMLDTGLQSLATTGNPLAAAGQAGLAGLTMGAAKVGGQLGERAVGDWMTKYMVGQPTNVADQLMNRYVGKEITQGVLPKIGGGVGAAAGAGLESELVRQVQEGPSNPFTVENVFSQAANAAVFSGIHAVGSLKSPRNLEAQGRLADWFNEYSKNEIARRRSGQTDTEGFAKQARPLIEESLSGNDTHPQARKDYWIVKMDKAATVVDPMERAAAVSEMTDQILSTKNLNQISLTAGRLSQIKPPETMGELVDVSKRYNDLRDLALRMIDERAASGEDVPSAAAVRQLSGQGLLPKMDLAWLKNEFGDAVERTLTGDDMMAFRVLSQKVMNHTLILARTAKEARAQSMTQASIESSGLSSDALDERNLTMGFVSAVNSVTSKPIRDALAERYIHHEQADQQYGKGEADKFMEEVTDVVNKIIEGKTPEQVAAIDWATAVAQVEKRVVQMSETGEEVRPIVARDSRLADYVATNEHGEYVKKVYGRPNRSQRELLAQEGQDLTEVIGAEDKVPVPVADEANWQYDLGQEASGTQAVEPKIPEVKGGGKAPKGLYDPSLDAVPVERQGVDTQAMALQLKDNVAALDDKKAWFALAPELTTMRGTIDSRKRESVQPYSKQIIAAVLELGTGRKERGEQTGEAIGPAGAALLAAKGMPEMTFEKYRAWLDELMNARVNPKYRENIVKRLAGVGETINLPVGNKASVSSLTSNYALPAEGLPVGRFGKSDGLFYGSKVSGPVRKTLPTRGQDVLTIKHNVLENQGDASNAPLNELLNNKLLTLDKDLFDLVHGKEGVEQPLDTDLLAAIQLKRDGYNVIHMIDSVDTGNVISVDLRHVTTEALTTQLRKQVAEADKFVLTQGPNRMEQFTTHLMTVRQGTVSLPVGKRSGVTGTETGFVNHIVEQFNKSLTGTETKGPQFQVGTTGQINGKGVVRAIQKWAPPEIFEYYKARGIEEFVGGKVTGDEFKRWLEENTPKVEVKLLRPAIDHKLPRPDEGGMSPEAAQHELETRGYELDEIQSGPLLRDGDGNRVNLMHPNNADLLRLFVQATSAALYYQPSNAATGRYGVDPKSLENMPGAVDILVRVPFLTEAESFAKDPKAMGSSQRKAARGILFEGPHFGTGVHGSDKNVLGHVRGYMEMTPTKKIFHVFEAQGDQAQKVAKWDSETAAKAKELRASGMTESDIKGILEIHYGPRPADHPLLAHYETLLMKTAIQHARSEGATHIAISDAETAMMTEGHDKHTSVMTENSENNQTLAKKFLTENPKYPGGFVKGDLQAIANGARVEGRESANFLKKLGITFVTDEPSQEPGMRAAYDERLPAIMRKLTGDRGNRVEFGTHEKALGMASMDGLDREVVGSPVFKNAQGLPKSKITARSYDITKPNPIEQRLFSATQPISAQVKPPTGNLGASNTGNPQADLYRVYTDAMLTKGYTPAEIKQDITQAMQILSNFENPRLQVAAFDPRSAYRNLTPGQIAGTVPPTYGQLATAGMYSTEDLVRPLVTLAMSHVAGDSPRELVRFNAKMSLVHELTHAVQYEPAGVYSGERKLARQQFENFANALSPDNRHAVLKVLADFAIPHEVLYKDGVMNSTIAGILRYGSNTGGGEQIPAFEMVNVASEILGVGMVMGGTKMKLRAEDIFNALPTEAALFIKGEYRNIMDHLGAFGEAARGLPGANASEVATWAKYVAKMVNRIAVSEEPAASLAKAQAIVAALDGKQFHGPARLIHVEELSVLLGNLVKKSDYSQVKPALNEARDLLFGPEEWHKTETTRPPLGAEEERYLVDFDQPPPKGPKVEQSLMEFPEDKRRRAQVNVGAFWQWAGLFHQTMAHMETRQLPLAQDVSKAFLGLLPAQQRMSVAMLKPFMTTDGKMDPGSPLVQMRQDKGLEGRRDNELVNRILKWQNENEKSGVVQQADGSWAADPKMAEDGIGDVRGFLPQRVVGSVLAVREVRFNQGQQLLSARIQSVTYRVAKLLMASQPKELKPLEYERTLEAAGLIVRGMVFDQQATTAQGLEQVLPPQREAVGRMLGGGLIDQLKSLNKMVTEQSGWSSTEQRAGDYMVSWYDTNGVYGSDGAHSLGEARKMRVDLQARGYTDVSVISKDEKTKLEQFDSPEGILHHYTELEQKAMEDFVTKNPANLTPDQLALIEAYAPTPGAAVGEMLSKRGTNVYLKRRRGVPTAYGLDYIDSMQESVSRLSGTISRQMTQAHVELILSDKRLDNQTEFKTLTRQSMQAALTPNSEWQRAASTAVSSYFLGGNLSSAIVNGFDTVSMLPETLLSQGDATYNTAKALGHYMKGMANVAGRMLGGEVDMGVLRTATAKLRVGQKLTPDETRNWVRQRAYDMKMLDRGQMHEVTQETDIKALTARAFGTNQKFPTLVDVAKDPFMRAVQLWMIMPRMVHSVNNQLSFEAGLEQAVDRGMGPQAALDHANKIRVLATFSGGKSNPTGAMAQMAGAPAALSMTRLSATMQAYAFGTMSKYMSHASNMIETDANLTPLAKRQARQAFGYMLSTHMAMAGLMGVAGVGAVMALLNKYFDVQAEAGVRKGVQQAASVVTSDPSVQGMVTELAMNGAPNQLFGAAVGARIGMGNVMGLSSYEGFNMLDVVPGAAAGAVSSVFKGLGYAAQGEPQQAIRSLVPAGLKNAVDMAANHMKFGDTKFRGPTGQVILDPTTAEKGMYLAGLQPSRLAQARSLSRLTDAALKSQQKADAKKRDEAAQQMLRGNLSPARELQGVANEANFPRTPSQATGVLQTLADRASVLNSPQDPLASVSYAASPEARRILQTFPAGTRIPASEVDRAKTRIQLEVQAGVPVDVGGLTREMQRAQLVENAMKKGMTRAEALKWVGLVTGN